MRIAGIDPGTKTFDIVVLEDEAVVFEESIDTAAVANNPGLIMESLIKAQVDYVAGPSGYGVPVLQGDKILNPRRLAVEVLLLSTEDDIEKGRKAGEIGIWVYDALAKITQALVDKYGRHVIFLPGVIHLRTIPTHRKINKIDMGTVDKLASTFIAIYNYSERNKLDYKDVDIIVAELGYGYNAFIAVEKGKIVDGIGGSSASIGTLTSGTMDLEIVVNTKKWERWDVFHGGLFWASGTFEIDKLIKGYIQAEEPYYTLFNAFIEGVVKDIARIRTSTPRANEVVLTGRHSKNSFLRKIIQESLRELTVIEPNGLKGAVRSKDAAQGYAAIGAGVLGGFFKDLVNHMDIYNACGTSVDYIVHPRAREFVHRVKKAYVESVLEPRLCY